MQTRQLYRYRSIWPGSLKASGYHVALMLLGAMLLTAGCAALTTLGQLQT